MADRLVFWHPTRDEPLPVGWFDWGEADQGSSADKRFRLKNESTTTKVLSAVVSFSTDVDPDPSIVDDFLISRDGVLFEATALLDSGLSAEAVSPVWTVRRNTPVVSTLGAASVDIIATPTGFADDAAGTATEAMAFTVTNKFPTPHIWFLSPDNVEEYQGSFFVVGQGFGEAQGLSRLWWGRGTDQQRTMEVISWVDEPATYVDAADRRIDQSSLANTNVSYQRVQTSVPSGQPFGTYDVTVETDDTDVVAAPDVDGGTAPETAFADGDLDGGSASSALVSSIDGGGA